VRNPIHLLPLIAGALLAAALPARADDPAPSAANRCGLTGSVKLAPIVSTHRLAPYPPDALRDNEEGRVFMRVVVDKYGAARDVVVVGSSGYLILDEAAKATVKNYWRWTPPPAECQDNGAIIPITYYWSIGSKPDPIYLDSPAYPPQARAHKQGGEGEVQYTLSQDNKATDVKVTSSTGSPELDAAMVGIMTRREFLIAGTASTGIAATRRFEFIPRNNPDTFAVLMGPPALPSRTIPAAKGPDYSFVQPFPPPSLANGCGRNEPVFLKPLPSTQVGPLYPIEAAASGRQGRTMLDVLLDRNGMASDVTVTQSSGLPELDEAAVHGIKGVWRWQAPPPECAEQGVHLQIHYDWFPGPWHMRFMPGDPQYPAAAIDGKLSGAGKARIDRARNGDLISTKVLTSTNSPILDAAMIKVLTDLRFTPGTGNKHYAGGITVPMDFVGDPDAMRANAPLRRIAPLPPPPGAANDCGRSGAAYLAPVASSHVLAQIPRVQVKSTERRYEGLTFTAQGALRMRVLVDKDGKAASVTVAQSSAPPEMERAVTGTVKENYRWAPPPPECADRGVAMNVDYVYTWAPDQLQFYADSADYPDAARQLPMGAAGIVQLRYRSPDDISETKILVGTGSPEIDERMVKLVTDLVLSAIKDNGQPKYITRAFPVMFMPKFVVSPSQRAAAAQKTATAPPP